MKMNDKNDRPEVGESPNSTVDGRISNADRPFDVDASVDGLPLGGGGVGEAHLTGLRLLQLDVEHAVQLHKSAWKRRNDPIREKIYTIADHAGKNA